MVALAVTLLIPASPALAISNDLYNCSIGSNPEYFFSGSNWTTALRNEVRNALSELSQPRHPSGVPFGTWHEISAADADSGDIEVRRADIAGWGLAQCSEKRITIDIERSGLGLRDTARHEGGHLMKALHSGDSDSFNSDNPASMSICPPPDTFRNLSQEDASWLQFNHGGTSPKMVTANPGYEDGTAYWGKSGGTWTLANGDTYSKQQGLGLKYLRFTSLDWSSDYLYQTTNFAYGQGKGLRGHLVYRRPTTATGTVRLDLLARSVTYAAAASGSCAEDQYPNGRDMNSRSSTGSWQVVATTGDVTLARYPFIGHLVFMTLYTPSWSSTNDRDVMIRLRRLNLTNSSGSQEPLDIDNLAVCTVGNATHCPS